MVNDIDTQKGQYENTAMYKRRVTIAIRILVDAKRLNLKCASLLYKSILILTLLYGDICYGRREKERCVG